MSNDLISRSTLMSRIESESRQWGEDYDAEQILGDVEDMPVAYDPDKVVEKLKYNIIGQLGQDGVIRIPLDKAIEIVKGGEND